MKLIRLGPPHRANIVYVGPFGNTITLLPNRIRGGIEVWLDDAAIDILYKECIPTQVVMDDRRTRERRGS